MNRDPDIKAEEHLLINLCRLRFDDRLKDEAESICRNGISWENFSLAANKHGVSALVYNNLESLGLIRYVSENSADFLRKAYFLSIARNTGIMNNMKEVFSILENDNFRTVLLKGMALELMVYGNRGLRQMTDADVLLPPEAGIQAFRILRKKGFRPLPVKSVFHRLILKHIGKHLPSLVKNGFSLEIHHELFGYGNKQLTSGFFETSYKSDLDGHDVWLPEPMMLFLYLIHHLYRHEADNDSQLRLYTDLAVLIDHFGEVIINPELLKLSENAGMNQMLADRMMALREHWHITFPDWFNEFIDRNAGREAISRFIFFLKSPKNNPAPDRSHSYRPLLKGIPGFHRKVVYVIGDLFPTISFMKNRYHCKSAMQAMMHYPHRLGKLIWLFRNDQPG